MPKRPEIPSGANLEQIKIVVNALYLCLGYAVDHIKRIEGANPSIEFKENMLNAVRNGNIDMSIFEDAKTYDFVVAMIEELIDETQAPPA